MGRPRKDATTQDVRERLIVAMADRLIREPASRRDGYVPHQGGGVQSQHVLLLFCRYRAVGRGGP